VGWNRESQFHKYEPYIPDAADFIGPTTGLSKTDIAKIGAKSVAAAFMTIGRQQSRAGIFLPDRSTVRSTSRNILQHGLDVRMYWSRLPHLSWRRAGGKWVPPEFVGHNWNTMMTLGKNNSARYIPGESYKNPNSGYDVSMCGLICPPDRAGDGYVNIGTKEEVWSKFLSPDYLRFFPNTLLYNS
jgi:hypothetical protein